MVTIRESGERGGEEEGTRLVLMTEEVFLSLVETYEEAEGKELEIDWGEKTVMTVMFFEPTVYEFTGEEEGEDDQ
jgi:hypothetical protein